MLIFPNESSRGYAIFCVSYILFRDMNDMVGPHVPAGGLPDYLHIRIFCVMKLIIDRWWNAADVRSSYWRLYVNSRDGAAVVTADGQRHPLPAGRVMIIPAWVRFSCVCRAAVPHFFCHFDVIGWPGELVRRTLVAPVLLPRDSGLEHLIKKTITRLPQSQPGSLDQSAAHPGVATVLRAKSILAEALALFLDAQPASNQKILAGWPMVDNRIAAAVRHIDARLESDLSVPSLSRLTHLSPDHFARRFRQSVGQSPAQYVIERRCARAAELLTLTPSKIDEIADTTGFTNRFYFGRVFKRIMGVSPAQFRRSQRV
jgi:AraC-like DNA-binding protein